MNKVPALSPTGLAIGIVLIGGNLAAALSGGVVHIALGGAMALVNATAYLVVIGSFVAVRKATQQAAVFKALAAANLAGLADSSVASASEATTEDVFRRLLEGDE